jgi:energy-coupling factor transporter ATP-binding protein EcfA2
VRVAKLELKEIGPFEDAVFEIPEPKGPGELVLFEGPNGSGKTTIARILAAVVVDRFDFFSHIDDGERAPSADLRRRFRSRAGALLVGVEEAAHTSLMKITPEGVVREPEETFERLGGAIVDVVSPRLRAWAAFGYQGHQSTPVVTTRGPTEISSPPLRGALSFGNVHPASDDFGQLLVNLDQEVAKSFREAHRDGVPSERRQEMEQLAASRQKMLDEIARALSKALTRTVTFEVPVGQHAPVVSLDGEPIPLDLLGEGMRSTFAWLSDLLVRLHRVTWEDATRSPLEQDFWLILDEIDESLHPTMQVRILPAIRELFPNARIYATTHSPFVVASVGEGVVFPIRPDKDHRVRGKVEPVALEPGQSLEWVVTEVFQAQAGFVDPGTRDALDAHKRDVRKLQRKGDLDWEAFLARRDGLMKLNDEVRTVVAMQEVPVREEVDRRLLARGEAREQGNGV